MNDGETQTSYYFDYAYDFFFFFQKFVKHTGDIQL